MTFRCARWLLAYDVNIAKISERGEDITNICFGEIGRNLALTRHQLQEENVKERGKALDSKAIVNDKMKRKQHIANCKSNQGIKKRNIATHTTNSFQSLLMSAFFYAEHKRQQPRIHKEQAQTESQRSHQAQTNRSTKIAPNSCHSIITHLSSKDTNEQTNKHRRKEAIEQGNGNCQIFFFVEIPGGCCPCGIESRGCR